jgi:hypothetical protein
MPIAIPSVGTPAYRYALNWTPSYSQKLAWRLKKLAAWVAEVTFGCSHRHITLPFDDHQTCLDCGATRLYIFNTEMYLGGITDAPIFIGRWKKAACPGTVQQISAIDAANALRAENDRQWVAMEAGEAIGAEAVRG